MTISLAFVELMGLARDLGNVEAQSQSGVLQLVKSEPSRLKGIVPGNGFAFCPSAEDRDEDEVLPQAAFVIEIECIDRREHADGISIDTRLFA